MRRVLQVLLLIAVLSVGATIGRRTASTAAAQEDTTICYVPKGPGRVVAVSPGVAAFEDPSGNIFVYHTDNLYKHGAYCGIWQEIIRSDKPK